MEVAGTGVLVDGSGVFVADGVRVGVFVAFGVLVGEAVPVVLAVGVGVAGGAFGSGPGGLSLR